MSKYTFAFFVAVSILLPDSRAWGVPPEKKCYTDRLKAVSKHHACVEKALYKYLGFDFLTLHESVGKCRLRLEKAVAKLQNIAGTECDAARWTDNGDGTVTDNFTRLQWEKKTNNSNIHDRDNEYTLSFADGAPFTGELANGSAFTVFLSSLNSSCFAGHCDWRAPTLAEINTIRLTDDESCAVSPCINPVFGSFLPISAYTTMTANPLVPSQHLLFSFIHNGTFGGDWRENTNPVIAVRGSTF